MPIRAETKKGLSQLNIIGDMTIYTAADLRCELLKHLNRGAIEIDLSEVSEMDSAGLQLLIMAKREALHHGWDMRLSGHSRAALEVLDVCALESYFGDPVVIAHGVNA